jgi:lysophospholipase L1-like esterase
MNPAPGSTIGANANIGGHLHQFLRGKAVATLRIALVSAAALALVSACSKPPSLAPLSSRATVLAFGDSLTFGTGATSGESYPAQLATMIARNVVAAGVPGEVSADGLARLPQAIDEHQPALLILCHGGNDFLRKQSDAATAANVRAMVKLARDKNIAVVLIATPKPGFSVAPPDFYAKIAQEFALPMEEKVLKRVLTDNNLKSDLVHPNAAGYRALAESVAALLRKAGAL